MQSASKSFHDAFACTLAAWKVTITGTTLSKRDTDGELLEFVWPASWCTGMPNCGKHVAQGNGCPYKKAV